MHRLALRSRSPELYRSIGYVAILAILIGSAAGLAIPSGLHWDFANYYDAGRKALAGEFADLYNPYARIQGHPPQGSMSFKSLPITSLLYIPIATLSPKIALLFFKLQSMVCLFGGLLLLYRHIYQNARWNELERSRFFAMFALSALLFQPFWTVYVVGGQTTPLIFLLLVIAVIQHGRGAVVVPVLCWTVAVLIKPVFSPGLLFLFFVSGSRFRRAALVAAGTVVAVSLLAFGVDLHLVLASRVLKEGAVLNLPYQNSHMFAWVEPVWLSAADYQALHFMPTGLKLTTTALRLATIGLMIWIYVRFVRSNPDETAKKHFAMMTAMMLSLVASPVVWAHYISVLFIVIAFALGNYENLPRPARAIIGTAVLSSVFQNLLFWWLVRRWSGLDAQYELIAAAVVKSVPMSAIFLLMMVWPRNLVGCRSGSSPLPSAAKRDVVSYSNMRSAVGGK